MTITASGHRERPAIEASGLVKSFGDAHAVNGLDLAVAAGGVYGFLGPNGAGKTTTIRMLATLLRPDAGSARVFGHDVVEDGDAVRSRISLTGQFSSVDDDLTANENLVILARLLGWSRRGARSRSRDLLDAFGLGGAADRQVKRFSGGMRRRLDIAASIVAGPDLLFLDEPTTGLDPRSRSQVWSLVAALVAEGTTVLLTTQYLDEADRVADRIAVIDHGRVIAEGTPGALKASVGAGSLSVRLHDPGRRDAARLLLARRLDTTVDLDADPAGLTVTVGGTTSAGGAAQVNRALADLGDAGIEVSEFALGRPSLDEVFLALTGRPADATPTPTPEESAA